MRTILLLIICIIAYALPVICGAFSLWLTIQHYKSGNDFWGSLWLMGTIINIASIVQMSWK